MHTQQNPDQEPSPTLHRSKGMRVLLWCAGMTALILAILGILLPGLPATPFALLAGACFVRASPSTHAWLLNTRLFGPMLQDWEKHRNITRRTKFYALATMLLMSSVSLWLLNGQAWLQITVIAGALTGAAAVSYLPTRPE